MYADGWVYGPGPTASANPLLYTGSGTGSNTTFYRNGNLLATTGGGSPWQLVYGGYPTSEFSDGKIAEVVAFSERLNDVTRILVENYLSAKYAVALSANDVYNGDTAGNGDFDLDMAGIGRFGGNNHTQAHSVGMIVVNRTFLQDSGDWLTFGHLTPTSSKTTADVPTSGDWATAANPMRWARHWYFTRTDANANGGTVDIIFDFSEGGMDGKLPAAPASNYRLLKRSGTSGQFSDIATTTAIVGDQVQFLGVDVNLLGSNFTLGTLTTQARPRSACNPLQPCQWISPCHASRRSDWARSC